MDTQTLATRYFSYSEAAAYIGVSIGTLRRMVESGKVRSYPIGERLVRFDRLELDQLVRGETSNESEQGT